MRYVGSLSKIIGVNGKQINEPTRDPKHSPSNSDVVWLNAYRFRTPQKPMENEGFRRPKYGL